MEDTGKKISNVEWGLVIGALLLVDLTEIGLDIITIGTWAVGASEILDLGVAFLFMMYVNLRVNKVDWKKIVTQIVGFSGKELSAGALPLWCLEGLVLFGLQKFDEKAAKLGVVGKMASQALHAQAGSAGVTGEAAPEAPTPATIKPNVTALQDAGAANPANTIDLRKPAEGSGSSREESQRIVAEQQAARDRQNKERAELRDKGFVYDAARGGGRYEESFDNRKQDGDVVTQAREERVRSAQERQQSGAWNSGETGSSPSTPSASPASSTAKTSSSSAPSSPPSSSGSGSSGSSSSSGSSNSGGSGGSGGSSGGGAAASASSGSSGK